MHHVANDILIQVASARVASLVSRPFDTYAACDSHPQLRTSAANAWPAQFVHNEWIESYDPTIEDSYRIHVQVDVSLQQ